MRPYVILGVVGVFFFAHGSELLGEKIPPSNYPTTLYLAGSGPDANGAMSDVRIIQHFTILEQPDGKGDYVSNDFADEDRYRFDMKAKGGLNVFIHSVPVRTDAHWTITSTWLLPHYNYTILSGTIEDFRYGGPKGISSARLVTDCRGYRMDRSHLIFRPGAYQGYLNHDEACGRLRWGTYKLTWYHGLNVGYLSPVP